MQHPFVSVATLINYRNVHILILSKGSYADKQIAERLNNIRASELGI